MAYNTLNTYDARARIPQFQGLMQYGNEGTNNPCYAREAVNMMTPGGVLQPCAKPKTLEPELDSPIETLAQFYRRWHAVDGEREVLVAASDGKLFYALKNADEWTQLPFPEGVTAYESNRWSWVTYEINEAGKDPIDILLLSNAKDGMVFVRGDTLPWQEVTDTMKKAGNFNASSDVRTLLLAKESMVKNLLDSCLYDSLVDPKGNVVDEQSFQSILSQISKKDAHDFNTFWELLNAKTLKSDKKNDNKNSNKIFSEYIDIDAAIEQLEAKHPNFREVIDEAENWITEFMQTWLVDTNMISQSILDHLREVAPYYIPAFRTGNQTVSSGQNANTPNNGLKRRKGSTKDIDNPVMRMVEYMQHYIANYKNVEILRAFDDTMKEYPELNSIAEPVQGDMVRFSYHDASQQAKNVLGKSIEFLNGFFDETVITPQVETLLVNALDNMPEQGFFEKDTATGNDVLNIPLKDGTYA